MSRMITPKVPKNFHVQDMDVKYKGEIVSIKPEQLRELINDVLHYMGKHSDAAVELLMLTAATESHCGTYINQVGGPALGIFQMEPATEQDIFKNYLLYNQDLRAEILDFKFSVYTHESLNLRANLPYQIAIARVHYLRVSAPLPDATDIKGLAEYWKKYWNTPLGKGKVNEAIDNYYRYAME
jgi:hypothetical protein